jgi:hypothetical protein
VSGQAARHAITTAVSGPFFAGVVISATTARQLAANSDVMLYDNPNAFLLCHFRHEQALCQRKGIADAPRLDRCRPECGNVVRTDHHADQLRHRADFLPPSTPRLGDRRVAWNLATAKFADACAGPTYEATGSHIRVDQMHLSEALAQTGYRVGDHDGLSDHKPVIIELDPSLIA